MAEPDQQDELREVVDPRAPVRRSPAPDAPLDTEALKGERVVVHEMTGEGWCRGTLVADGYAGWLPTNALAAPGPDLTHKVVVPRTLVFPGPNIKLAPIEALSLESRLAVVRIEELFAVTHTGGYIPARHLAPLDIMARDPVAVAESLLAVPYLWGGKTSLGVDCSGLVQLALAACGIKSPRDSVDQERTLGTPVAAGLSNIRRGDLLFWKGHVAIARDAETLIHANAFHMAVAIEPIAEAVARIRASGSELSGVRRLG